MSGTICLWCPLYLLTFVVLIHVSQGIVISDVMRLIMRQATDNFVEMMDAMNSDEDHAPQITPVEQIPESVRKQLTNAKGKDKSKGSTVRWDMHVTYPYLLWDPLTQFKRVFRKNKLTCPLCSADGIESSDVCRTNEWFDGRKPRLNPRVFFDIRTPTLLVSAKYKCCHGHEIAACHAVILQLLRSYVKIPFILTHRQGFALTLINRIEELIDEGQSMDEVEKFIKWQYMATFDQFQASFFAELEQLKSLGVSYDESNTFFPTFVPDYFPRPTVTTLMDTFIKRFFQNEHLYESSMSSLKAQCMTFDHTYKDICNIGYKSEEKKWVNQYNSVFCVLNEKGEVINWQFTSGDVDETQAIKLITTLKGKFAPGSLGIMCVDDCCRWQELAKGIWPHTLIKQHVIHAVQQFRKKSRKKWTVYEEMAVDYEKVFRHPLDTGDTREMDTADKYTIMANIDQFITKWTNTRYDGLKVLTKGHMDAIEELRPHILKDCLSGIPASCSNFISADEHEKIKKLLCRKIGVQLGYVKFSRFFFNHNQQLGDNESMDSLSYRESLDACQASEANLDTSVLDARSHSINAVNISRMPDKELITSVHMTSSAVDEMFAILGEILETERTILSTIDVSTIGGTDSVLESFANLEQCTSILQHALAIFKVVLLVENVWSYNRDNLLKIPFLFQNDKTCSPVTDNAAQNEDLQNYTQDCTRLQNNAKAFGFSIVPVTGDGNCFFTSVAFQLLQILSNECPTETLEVLQSLQITAHRSAEDLSVLLRDLVVNEWLANENDYQSFFTGMDLQNEAERFRRNGEFAGALGDALPIAMANVLNIPILIFTTVHNMPIVSVAPRQTFNRDAVIYLSYTQQGAGHYDALVSQVEMSTDKTAAEVVESTENPTLSEKTTTGTQIEVTRTEREVEKTEGEVNDTEGEVNDTEGEVNDTEGEVKNTEGDTKGKFIQDAKEEVTETKRRRTRCRCGINSSKKESSGKLPRNYRATKRCRCVKAKFPCTERCSCHGACGATACGGGGPKVRRGPEYEALTRRGRQRKLHDIQQVETCPNSKIFLDSMFPDAIVSSTIPINMLEYVIVAVIILYLESNLGTSRVSDVKEHYDSILSFIAKFKIVLLVSCKTLADLTKLINHMLTVRKGMQ